MSDPINAQVRRDFAQKALDMVTRSDLLFEEASKKPKSDQGTDWLYSEVAHLRQVAITYAVLATASSLDDLRIML